MAQRLAPEDPAAFGLAARLDLECGKPLTALAAAQKAVELESRHRSNIRSRWPMRSVSWASRARHWSCTRTVLQQSDLSPLDQARARFILGRMLATTAPRNYRQAMEETVTAIKVAAAQIESADEETRGAVAAGPDRCGTVAGGDSGLRSLEAETPGDPAVAGHGGEGGQRVHREGRRTRAGCC